MLREKEPFEINLVFVVVERIWRSFVLCGERIMPPKKKNKKRRKTAVPHVVECVS